MNEPYNLKLTPTQIDTMAAAFNFFQRHLSETALAVQAQINEQNKAREAANGGAQGAGNVVQMSQKEGA